jgi:DNA-binding CsgD family transcriptional regulator
MSEIGRPDTFLVASASLELLADTATRSPLVVCVDDAQWLDSPTADVIGFVARRLAPEQIFLAIALTEGYKSSLLELGLPELRLDPLDDGSSQVLLDSLGPLPSPGLRRRVLEAAAGVPLALVELKAELTFGSPAGLGLSGRLPMTDRLRNALAGRFSDLPRASQAIVLLAATEERARLGELLAAAALLGEDVHPALDDLGPAVTCGLVTHENTQVRFVHPLMPAAIYQSVAPSQRQRTHLAIATVLSEYPEIQAWHRAASVTTSDGRVASELESAALTVVAHMEPGMRLAAMERAADLTLDTDCRQRRLLRAAELALDLGHPERAGWLVSEIDASSWGPLDRTRMRLLRNFVDAGRITDPSTVDSLLEASIQAGLENETDLALRLLQAAALHSWWLDLGPEVGGRIVAATERVAPGGQSPKAISILAIADPEGSGRALARVASQIHSTSCDAETTCALGSALHISGAFDRSAIFLSEAIKLLRQHGSRWLLPRALSQLAWNNVFAGHWKLASTEAQEALTLAQEMRQPLWEASAQTVQALNAAVRGDYEAADALLIEAEGIALPIGARAVLADIQLARAIMALGDGRFEEAFQHLQRTFDPHDPSHHRIRSFWRIGELAEAAAYAGRGDEVQAHLVSCEELAERAWSPRLNVGLSYARPLLAADHSAEMKFRMSLAEDLSSWPLYRARLLLQYGTWLRRRRKIAEARMPLRAARDSLSALGAVPWAERARQELRASRETQHNHPGAWAELTQQELQIAHMAAEGLSNREIAQRLYISPRTVGCHLYRIFPKLRISTRAHLNAALEDSDYTALAS